MLTIRRRGNAGKWYVRGYVALGERSIQVAEFSTGTTGFTVHDWRHHWASHCVMAGVDLITIMRVGGWKSLRMVQRYAAIDTAHMYEAVAKLS